MTSRPVRYLAFILTAFAARPVLAQEKWHVDASVQGAVPDIFRGLGWQAVVYAAVALLLVFVTVMLDRRQRRLPKAARSRVESWAPMVLGIAVGLDLMTAALDRTLFAPDLVIPDGTLGTIAVVVELVAGLMLVLGLFTRLAALGLLALSIAAFVWTGLATLDYLAMIGAATFLLVWGRGRFSLGSVMSRIFFAIDTEHLRPIGLTALRLSLGATLVAQGIGRLIRPDLYLRFIESFPVLNPYSIVHALIPAVTPEWYVLMLAIKWIALGILIILGPFQRIVAALMLVWLLITPLMTGLVDYLWLLPMIGGFAALLLLGRRGKRF